MLLRKEYSIELKLESMFGLLELSRQRLRTSLIERSFEKCPYCNGSGIILNINSIIEQVIKVIKEKLISSKNPNIKVKCNLSLDETLMNIKRKEINALENDYNANIIFSFDNHFSLHEPLIELEEKTNNIKIKKDIKTKKVSKKSNKILNKNNKQIKKKKKVAKKIAIDDKKIIKVNKNIIVEEKNKPSDKSGWWAK